MNAPAPYPEPFAIEDFEKLEALASYNPPPSFEEAFSRLSGETSEESAREFYTDALAYSQPSNPAP